MSWLILAVLLEFVFVQMLKFAQRRGDAAPVVVTTNYLVVATALLIYLVTCGTLAAPVAAVVTGVLSGSVFLLSMLLFNRALQLAAVGPVLTAYRMALVVPLVPGVLLWGETLGVAQLGGLLLALAALVLMSARPGEASRLGSGAMLRLLLAVFVVQGVCGTAMRSVHYQGLDAFLLPVLLVASLTAGSLGMGYLWWRGVRPAGPAVRLGLGLGTYNALALPAVMTALSHWPGTIYFPITGCGVLVLDHLCAHFWWREKLSRFAMAGLALALMSLALILSESAGLPI